MKLSCVLAENQKKISEIISADDVIFFEFLAGDKNALAIYAEDLSDKVTIGKQVVKPMQENGGFSTFDDFKSKVNLPESEMLKTYPAEFESLRNNYNYREEYF